MRPSESSVEIVALDPESIDPVSSLLRLNNDHATELSYLEPGDLRTMITRACVAVRAKDMDAFVLAFDETADYGSPNFLWFRERFDRFVYVDRICVDPALRGRGLARRLYEHIFDYARSVGAGRVVCEVNAELPNPASDAFHASLDFHEVGSVLLPDRKKRVTYYERRL
ncbi:GNAT family N-acetyltransferase [Breoghania sp.]|uniref:GNAT family N-acetyltransferase n=1 Tax=Breoghania sp. TaxID=2065378 RepID=UPI002621C5E5|nr:GNAT family N-acetyltransferase [Breoghania sp.]MDJ0930858.1 GNAT family N-acetyltransferase [Breoghania sp.]